MSDTTPDIADFYDFDDDFPYPHLDDPRINDLPNQPPTTFDEVPF